MTSSTPHPNPLLLRFLLRRKVQGNPSLGCPLTGRSVHRTVRISPVRPRKRGEGIIFFGELMTQDTSHSQDLIPS